MKEKLDTLLGMVRRRIYIQMDAKVRLCAVSISIVVVTLGWDRRKRNNRVMYSGAALEEPTYKVSMMGS